MDILWKCNLSGCDCGCGWGCSCGFCLVAVVVVAVVHLLLLLVAVVVVVVVMAVVVVVSGSHCVTKVGWICVSLGLTAQETADLLDAGLIRITSGRSIFDLNQGFSCCSDATCLLSLMRNHFCLFFK